MPTPHIAAEKGDIAKTVIMPGDPLRAKYIAEHYLESAKCFTSIRNILGYTGMFHGKQISVMASGMGMPSIGIYSYELYHFYGVETIIRIGTAGGISPQVHVKDIVCAMGACTDSRYIDQFGLNGSFSAIGDFEMIKKAQMIAKEKNIGFHIGNVLSSDIYYEEEDFMSNWKKMGVLAVEMESAALYINAARAGKKALALLTISASDFEEKTLSARETEQCMQDMIELSLKIGVGEEEK